MYLSMFYLSKAVTHVPQGTAPLDVEVRDSSNAVFKHSFDAPAKGA